MPTVNFTPEDWARVQADTLAWWAGELPRPLVFLAATDPVPPTRLYSYMSNYPLTLPADAIVDCYEPYIAATHFYADAFPVLWMNFGPGIAAGFMGSQVNSVSEPSETVWFTPPRETPLAELQLAHDPASPWFQRTADLTTAFTQRYAGQLQVGMTDLGGNLDIVASFRGTQQLLLDVIEAPEEVDRLVRQTTAAWIDYYGRLDALIRPTCRGTSCWTPLWSPGRTYMLQCDFSYMISPAMFERFVVPDLVACCDFLDHGFYHLDGKGEIPHLDLLLDIERLRGIQWISGDGQPTPDQWLPLLKRIRDGGKLCQVFVTPEGARHIVRNLGGRGFLVVIQPRDASFRDHEVAHGFLKTLAQEDISLL